VLRGRIVEHADRRRQRQRRRRDSIAERKRNVFAERKRNGFTERKPARDGKRRVEQPFAFRRRVAEPNANGRFGLDALR
jgi:hypothetical protein